MQALLRFLGHMDARAARAIAVSLGLFVAVAVIIVIGKTTAVFDEDDAPVITWMQENADSAWALPITILVFTLAAFLGAPQFALIAGAVVAFGPGRGAVNAWIATMAAASFMFWLGRWVGADTLRRYGGDTVNRMSRFIGRNGFLASLTVRFVPLAPAILVNMAAGVTAMRYAVFAAGTGLGIIPKIALVAFAGQGLLTVLQGGSWVLVLALLAAAGVWLIIMLAARRRLRAQEAVIAAQTDASTSPSPRKEANGAAVKDAPASSSAPAVAPVADAAPTPDDAPNAGAHRAGG